VISVTEHADGCVLSVRAQPGARRNAIVGEQAGCLKVAVTAPADQGRANKALVEVLADGLGLKRSQIELVSGASQRSKRFLLRGMTARQVTERLQTTLERKGEREIGR
jgi:uncharacterized protein (TIGR00251 family)